MTKEPNEPNQQSEAPPPPSPEEPQKSPAHNFWFAIIALGIAVAAFALTILLFRDLFEDPAIVTGALGALFTLIGTVAGAYFGVKSSSDTADRAVRQVSAANARTETANRSAKAAWGGLEPGVAENLRKQGLA